MKLATSPLLIRLMASSFIVSIVLYFFYFAIF